MSEPHPLRPDEPSRIGEYRLLGRVGTGGQGAVYLGESAAGVRVAVKVLHSHVAGDPRNHRRFLREVEAARQVPQFCTARILDAGTAGERPYVVSEFIEGESLEQRVGSRGPLGPRDLERLAVGTATALAAIHGSGIVHRDFKPANVLLGPDGPRVVDFGIARSTSMTATSASVVGTPPYMSPEQLSGEEVGPPSDMFSWAGTILFAGTGRTPFGRDIAIAALVYRILHHEPDLTGLPDGLREIVGRCLAKAPGSRPTAEQVLLGLITGNGTARSDVPVSTGDLLVTAMGRVAHPSAPPAAPASGTGPSPMASYSTGPSPMGAQPTGPSGWVPPPTGPSSTRPSAGVSRRNLLIGGGAALATGVVAGAAVLIPRYLREKDSTVGAQPGTEVTSSLRPSQSHSPSSLSSSTGGPSASPSGTPSAGPSPSGPLPPGRDPLVLRNGQLVQGLAISADGRTVAAGCWDGKIRLWEAPSGKMIDELDDRKFYVEGLALSPDGRTLVSVGGVQDTEAHVWDVGSRRRVSKSVVGSVFARFSPDGGLFVTGSGYEWVRLWRTSSRKQAGASMRHTEFVRNAAFSPDGSLLATAGWDDRVRIWRTSDGKASGSPLTGHKDSVNAVVFLDGETLASAGYDKVVRVWDLSSRKPAGEAFKGAKTTVNTMALSPDGTLLAAGTDRNGVLLWDVATREQLPQPVPKGQIQAVAFSADGTVLAVALGNEVGLFDVASLRTA
ncbi:WD40 repeat domain-containing serine/threonine protein kinase [Planobispora rosea]|uniref:WD40 repeat domain-containing serine/threonine protein kinase n=1 Tax=Planobispora rosea TaxID=35762 RepID=UPI00083A1EEE|nr:serine/threonine-protein kinase [Planobispora rosea]